MDDGTRAGSEQAGANEETAGTSEQLNTSRERKNSRLFSLLVRRISLYANIVNYFGNNDLFHL